METSKLVEMLGIVYIDNVNIKLKKSLQFQIQWLKHLTSHKLHLISSNPDAKIVRNLMRLSVDVQASKGLV